MFHVCRSRNIVIHEGPLFKPRTKEYNLGDALPVRKPPKLVIVDVSFEVALLNGSTASNKALKNATGALVQSMHLFKMVAIAMLRPWFTHDARVEGATVE